MRSVRYISRRSKTLYLSQGLATFTDKLFDMDFANFLGLLAIFLGLCRAEIFTSLAEMEYLVETERTMISSLKNYIQLEEERLQTMKSFVSRLDNVMDIINQTDPGKYLANPVNSYLMLKRFNVDWRNLETLLTEDLAEGNSDF